MVFRVDSRRSRLPVPLAFFLGSWFAACYRSFLLWLTSQKQIKKKKRLFRLITQRIPNWDFFCSSRKSGHC